MLRSLFKNMTPVKRSVASAALTCSLITITTVHAFPGYGRTILQAEGPLPPLVNECFPISC